MSIEAGRLLAELAEAGVKVSVSEGHLRVHSPRGALTEALRSRIGKHKSDLLALLVGAQDAGEIAPSESRIIAAPGDEDAPFPLSDLQRGFYMADDAFMELHVRPHCYMEFDRVHFDVERYEAAWNKALLRHRRALCIADEDGNLKALTGLPSISIPVDDLRGYDAAVVGARLEETRLAMERKVLPLQTWPWFDLRISRWEVNGEERFRIHYNHNNFFIDGYGLTLLLSEIEDYYANPERTLSPLTLSCRDAVLGLAAQERSARGQSARSYWWGRIPTLPRPPALPRRPGFDMRSRAVMHRRERLLPAQTWAALKALAAAHGCTPSNALIAAYSLILGAWSNSRHFILSQMATRRLVHPHPEMLQIIGNFVSLYPLEITLRPGDTFAQTALAIQDRVLEDVRHLEFGGMQVMRELNRVQGSPGSAPSPFVVGSGLYLRNWHRADYTVLETSQTVLDHQFFELADGRLQYVWDLVEEYFPAGVVDDMWSAYSELLETLAADARHWSVTLKPQPRTADLEVRRRCNDTATDFTLPCLHQPAWSWARSHPDRVAIRDGTGPCTYAELDAWSDELAARLEEAGVAQGDRVAIALHKDATIAASALATLKIGAAYVPVDPDWPAARIEHVISEVKARALFVAPAWDVNVIDPLVTRIEPAALRCSCGRSPRRASVCANDALAYIMYTSGSTGRPKGVMIDHRGAMNTLQDINRRFGVGSGDVILGVSAFNFDLSVYDLFGALEAGATVTYPDPEHAHDPRHWIDCIERCHVTIWNSVPALMKLLLEAALLEGVTLPTLRVILLSGDKIPLDLPDLAKKVAPRAEVWSLGGATEASIWSIAYRIGNVDPHWTTIPYGYPLANQAWHVLDESGDPCPRWVPGDLHIGGLELALGYWENEELTARAFQQHPTLGRLYRTGDIGRYTDDGCIEWLGRSDLQLKIQGHRIELEEIEAILRQSPGIFEAAVCAAQGPQGQPYLLGHVVWKVGEARDPRDLEREIGLMLPAHMVPRRWRVWEKLPLSANGKIDRRQLLSGADEQEPVASDKTYREPVTPEEARLQALWQRVLGLDRISVEADFFELGGQSFEAIRIAAAARRELDAPLSLRDIWQCRTIRALARRMRATECAGATGPLVRLNSVYEGFPVFFVHAAGGSVAAYAKLARRLERPVYGFEAPKPESHSVDRDFIPRLARRYVKALLSERPADRFTLAGWSTGAAIAFAMTAELESLGCHRGRLLLLDGPSPWENPDLCERNLLTWFFDDLALGLPVERLSSLDLQGLSVTQRLESAARLLGLEARVGFDVRELEPAFLTFTAMVQGANLYRPPPISSDFLVLRVERDIVREFRAHPQHFAPDWGWGRFTSGRVSTAVVPGDHYSFLHEESFIAWLAQAIA